MDLFTRIVDEKKCNPNFLWVLGDERKSEREELSKWADGFPDRDNKFVKEFQTTFNSCFWEIYLYAIFKEYQFEFDWSQSAPDFSVITENYNLMIEATTANAAQDKPNEWDRSLDIEKLKDIYKNLSITDINKEAIIRISNSILSKFKKYQKGYSKLPHVKGKPFIIAVAPFEQPYFNLQYNRPIKAVLYDYYVDEDAHSKEPEKYPNGPPDIQLGSIKKDNGAEIPLGFFNDSQMRDVSAIIFSCTATWGKLDTLTTNPKVQRLIESVWATKPHGAPKPMLSKNGESPEILTDGLQIYHNPYAKHPIPPEIFRKERVMQCIADPLANTFIEEESNNCLIFRHVKNFIARTNISDSRKQLPS